MNLYIYCSNNPVILIDPSGNAPWHAWSDFKSDWAGRQILLHYLFGGGKDFNRVENNRWTKYMMENERLMLKLMILVRDLASEVNVGETEEFNMTTSMEINNGEQIIGYQYLHGTNADVGGFQITGNINKNSEGNSVIDFTYTWNDVMDPNPDYTTDINKAAFAEKIPFANPTPYDLQIQWSDTSILSADGIFESGWLSKDTTVHLEPIPLPTPPMNSLESKYREEIK